MNNFFTNEASANRIMYGISNMLNFSIGVAAFCKHEIMGMGWLHVFY